MNAAKNWHETDSLGRVRREQRLHESPKFLRAERFREVPVDTDLFGTFSLDSLVCSCKQHDFRVRKARVLAHAAADLDPVYAAGQHEIEEDEVWLLLLAGFERGWAIDSFDEVVIGIAERQRDELSQVRLIVDD
jgi:hypothetical protein